MRVDHSGQPSTSAKDFESEVRLLATGLLIIEAVHSHIDFFQFFSAVAERRGHMLPGSNNYGHVRSQHKAIGLLDAFGSNFEYFCHCCYCLVMATKLHHKNASTWQCWDIVRFQSHRPYRPSSSPSAHANSSAVAVGDLSFKRDQPHQHHLLDRLDLRIHPAEGKV